MCPQYSVQGVRCSAAAVSAAVITYIAVLSLQKISNTKYNGKNKKSV